MREGLAVWRALGPFESGLLFFFLGLCVGSFCSVVRYRVPRGWSLVAPGSRCPTCFHPLRAWDLIPVVSYLLLRGRCRHCRMPIPPTYLIMEVAAGLLAGIAAAAQGWEAGLIAMAVWLLGNLMLSLVERHYTMRDESGVTLVETVVALALLTAVAIPMLDLGGNIRGGTPFQRQMAVSLASSKVEDLLNYAWLNVPWPPGGSETLAVGTFMYDLTWDVTPFGSGAPDDYPSESSQLRKAVVEVTCQNCTRTMPTVRVVALLAKS